MWQNRKGSDSEKTYLLRGLAAEKHSYILRTGVDVHILECVFPQAQETVRVAGSRRGFVKEGVVEECVNGGFAVRMWCF